MTSSYKVVFIASALITLSLFFIIMNSGSQNQAPTFFWAMTVWYMYKHDYQASVTLQKIMMGFSGLATMAFAIGSFQEDKTISNLLGFSPYEMIIPGLISFCVHFWLLGFFQKRLSVDSDLTDDNVTSESGDKVQGGNEIGLDVWEAVAEEYDNNRNAGIWAMAFAQSKGNEDKAKALYLQTRAEQLTSEASIEQESKLVEEPLPESKTSSWLDSFVSIILIVPPARLAGAWLIYLDRGGSFNKLEILMPTLDDGATWFTVLWPFALIYWLVKRNKNTTKSLKAPRFHSQFKKRFKEGDFQAIDLFPVIIMLCLLLGVALVWS